MCGGAILLRGIRRAVVGENLAFRGPEAHLRAHGVDLEIRDAPECVRLMRDFIAAQPRLWNEDVGRRRARAPHAPQLAA